MKLYLKSLPREPSEVQFEGSAEDFPELKDAGCIGKLVGKAQVIPSSTNILFQLVVEGRLDRECGRCLDRLDDPFRIKANLLVEKGSGSGIEWDEEQQLGIEDYLVRVPSDVDELSLEHLVAEQVILNYEPHPLPAQDPQGNCIVCGRSSIQAADAADSAASNGSDPRWDKLKSLRNKPKE